MDMELSKAKRKTLLTKEQFFTKDSAKVVGYIKGYRVSLGFTTISLDASNYLTKEDRPITSEIDSSGRFISTIPLNHPRKVIIMFGERSTTLYLEPGQTLALSFDWEDCVKTNYFNNLTDPAQVLLFKGPLARLNYELKSFQLKTLGSRHFWIVKTYSPQAYLALMDSIFAKNDARVKEALKSGQYLKKVIEIQKNEALIYNGFYMLDYAMSRDTGGITIPKKFYKMFQLMPLNDPTAAISNFYDVFINRFEVNPVIRRGVKQFEQMRNIKNNESERLLRQWGRIDSVLKNDLKLTNSFAYEATKTRSLSKSFERMDKNEAYAFYSQFQKGITHPFLKQEGFRILKSRFGNEDVATSLSDGDVSLPSNTIRKPKWTAQLLPEGKDADIFRKLIAPHKGKYLFVDFWGTGCGPCRWGIEEKKETRDKYNNNPDFEFIFISCKNWSPDKNTYDKYVKAQGLKHSYLVSDDDFNYMMQLFRFRGIPHYLLIDQDGNILDTNLEMYLGFERARKWIQGK
ncbi:MAG: thioredoxin family protein [Bacteroidales bacterium]|nr:thioredoxin family protein [Bacteroidales bacterium]